jgi:hypothetical protein
MSRQTFSVSFGGGVRRKCGKKLATDWSRCSGTCASRANRSSSSRRR